MSKKGLLVCISGFSGVGKGTVTRMLTDTHSEYALSVSATSRKPREDEIEGVHYLFKTTEEFKQMIAEGKLIEYAEFVNHYYGTPSEYVFSKMEEGKDVILEIEVQGVLQIKEKYPEAILIFIMPPSAEELKNRLEGRSSESKEVINARLERAYEESAYCKYYNYIIVNEVQEQCAEQLHHLIQQQHNKVSEQKDFIEKIKEELKTFLKGE